MTPVSPALDQVLRTLEVPLTASMARYLVSLPGFYDHPEAPRLVKGTINSPEFRHCIHLFLETAPEEMTHWIMSRVTPDCVQALPSYLDILARRAHRVPADQFARWLYYAADPAQLMPYIALSRP